jgi:hypothetical protein
MLPLSRYEFAVVLALVGLVPVVPKSGPVGAAKAGAANPMDAAATALPTIVANVYFFIFFPLMFSIHKNGEVDRISSELAGS